MVVGIQGIKPEFLEQVSRGDAVANGVSYRNAAHGATATVVGIAQSCMGGLGGFG